jgi:hypothetical protein
LLSAKFATSPAGELLAEIDFPERIAIPVEYYNDNQEREYLGGLWRLAMITILYIWLSLILKSKIIDCFLRISERGHFPKIHMDETIHAALIASDGRTILVELVYLSENINTCLFQQLHFVISQL